MLSVDFCLLNIYLFSAEYVLRDTDIDILRTYVSNTYNAYDSYKNNKSTYDIVDMLDARFVFFMRNVAMYIICAIFIIPYTANTAIADSLIAYVFYYIIHISNSINASNESDIENAGYAVFVLLAVLALFAVSIWRVCKLIYSVYRNTRGAHRDNNAYDITVDVRLPRCMFDLHIDAPGIAIQHGVHARIANAAASVVIVIINAHIIMTYTRNNIAFYCALTSIATHVYYIAHCLAVYIINKYHVHRGTRSIENTHSGVAATAISLLLIMVEVFVAPNAEFIINTLRNVELRHNGNVDGATLFCVVCTVVAVAMYLVISDCFRCDLDYITHKVSNALRNALTITHSDNNDGDLQNDENDDKSDGVLENTAYGEYEEEEDLHNTTHDDEEEEEDLQNNLENDDDALVNARNDTEENNLENTHDVSESALLNMHSNLSNVSYIDYEICSTTRMYSGLLEHSIDVVFRVLLIAAVEYAHHVESAYYAVNIICEMYCMYRLYLLYCKRTWNNILNTVTCGALLALSLFNKSSLVCIRQAFSNDGQAHKLLCMVLYAPGVVCLLKYVYNIACGMLLKVSRTHDVVHDVQNIEVVEKLTCLYTEHRSNAAINKAIECAVVNNFSFMSHVVYTFYTLCYAMILVHVYA